MRIFRIIKIMVSFRKGAFWNKSMGKYCNLSWMYRDQELQPGTPYLYTNKRSTTLSTLLEGESWDIRKTQRRRREKGELLQQVRRMTEDA